MSAIVYEFPVPLKISSQLPQQEKTTPSAGMMQEVSAADHVHERLSSALNTITGADGYVDHIFSRTFSDKPTVTLTSVEVPNPDGFPRFTGVSWIMSGALYAGIRIYGEKPRSLPAVIALLGTLSNYKPWEPAPNAKVSVLAVRYSGT